MDLNYFRKNIKNLLKEKQLTLNSLAQKSDLSEDTLRSLIYGKSQDAKISTIVKISDVLDVSVDSLIGHNTRSAKEEKLLKSMHTLSPRSLDAVQALISLETHSTQQPSNKNETTILVFVPTGNVKDGGYYDSSSFIHHDISEYPVELRDLIDFGIMIPSDCFAPYYKPNDILLLSKKQVINYNDIIVYTDPQCKIYIRKYTKSGLEPVNNFGQIIPTSSLGQYKPIGIVVKVAKEFDIEQYR